ncbi:RNaseH domain-containing protein [Kribbella sp. NPDC051587]|uniref:RNaseH domain-containing protein n=1 Tax=Kribbella sp. NPDC051587 TaxID=3364119 RepID=UPI0037AD47CA
MNTVTNDLDKGLHTLTYRIDPQTLGTVALHHLTSDFLAGWDGITSQLRHRLGRDEVMPRYSALTTALTAVTGQPVHLFPGTYGSPDSGLLVTTEPIEPWVLRTAIRKFEQLTTGDHSSDQLAALLPVDDKPDVRELAEFIDSAPGTAVSAPGWVYEAARWTLAQRIAAAPLVIDGHRSIQLRMDTDGNLIAFDDPISRPFGPAKTGHATQYISTTITTLPGAAHLYLRLDAHVARHPMSWAFVKHTYISRGDDPRLPVLKLPVLSPYPEKGREAPLLQGHTADVIDALDLRAITLPTEFGSDAGPVRPIGKPLRHPIGKGPGVRFLYQLGQHVSRQLASPPLRYAKSALSVKDSEDHPIPAAKIDAAIQASGLEGLRIVCLYSTPTVRRRMQDAMGPYSLEHTNPLLGILDGEVIQLTPRLSVIMAAGGNLLQHGDHQRQIGNEPWLRSSTGTAVAVLAETYWDPEDRPAGDAKPVVRRLLGNRGVVCQFVNSNWEPPKPRSSAKNRAGDKPLESGPKSSDAGTDHPAIGAVRDLFRQAGVIDDRLGTALVKRGKNLLDRSAVLVGIHIRQHTPPRKNRRKAANSLVIRLTALYTRPDPDHPWLVKSSTAHGSPWTSYRESNAQYYGEPIGIEGLSRSFNDREKIRAYVDQALQAAGFPHDLPVVLFVDAESCKGVWPGLNDAALGRGPLPGDSLDHPDLAVVRCASGDRVPQATHRGHGGSVADPHQPNLPRAYVYEHNEAGTLSWLLTQPSKSYRGQQINSRAGATYTRWTLPANKERLNSDDWHALTSIEITIPKPGTWKPAVLAELTARLCHQAVAWDDRTRKPVPLHLAERSDRDHPQRKDNVESSE